MEPSVVQQPTAYTRRRDKVVLSCSFCRKRKLRCDRQTPCAACVRRGKETECVYSAPEHERTDAVDYRPHGRGQQMRQRVTRLERLVKDLEQTSGQPTRKLFSSQTVTNDLISTSGDDTAKLSLTDDNEVYTGSSHWSTILEDIRGLKDDLSEEHAQDQNCCSSDPSQISPRHDAPVTRLSLLTSSDCFSRQQILSMVPPRKVVDRHVSRFFNTYDLAPMVFSRDTFIAEYTSFWVDPSAAPIMWVGLLFGILSTSCLLQQQDPETLGTPASETHDSLETYRTSMIHCLVAGNYLSPSRYTIETLALYYGVDQHFDSHGSIAKWVLVGVMIRVAMRMGMHRDPSHWPSISPLRAEYRRRLWTALYQIDFFTSTQLGLPRIVKDSQCDVRPPVDLSDEVLSSEQACSPLNGLSTEPTSLSFFIARNAIIKVAAEIYDVTEAAVLSPMAIAELESKLQETVNDLPEWSKYKPLEMSIADSPITIMSRMLTDILKQKTFYLLHWRGLVRGPIGEGNVSSYNICIGAALAILAHQRKMNEEIQPGGIFFGIRWKVKSSLNHEFLQATMMLCLVLSRYKSGRGSTKSSIALPLQDDVQDALVFAKGLWEKDADQSTEARKAVDAIVTILGHGQDVTSTTTPWDPDSQRNTSATDPPRDLGQFRGPSGDFSGAIAQEYLHGFDYGQDMAMDPSLLAFDNDLGAFGSNAWDGFMDYEGEQGTWTAEGIASLDQWSRA